MRFELTYLCLNDTIHFTLSNFFFAYILLHQALQRKENFSDADIENYQELADHFFVNWLQMVGYDGVTNYFHMIGAGHVRYCHLPVECPTDENAALFCQPRGHVGNELK